LNESFFLIIGKQLVFSNAFSSNQVHFMLLLKRIILHYAGESSQEAEKEAAELATQITFKVDYYLNHKSAILGTGNPSPIIVVYGQHLVDFNQIWKPKLI